MPDLNIFKEESEKVTELANILSRHLIPLFSGSPKKRPEFVGTGFLVSSGADHYLVSAAHVFRQGGAELYYYVEPKLTHKIDGELRLTKSLEKGKPDRLDIGVLKMRGLVPPYLSVGRYPIPLKALRPSRLPREGKQYLFFGFPASKHHINVQGPEIASELCIYRTHSLSASKYPGFGVNEDTHIVLAFDPKKSVDHDGRIRTFPNPAGMSGSPVWLLHDESDPSNRGEIEVLGVIIEYHKKYRAMIATDIGMALTFIHGA